MAERPRVTTPLRRPDAEDYVPFVPRIRDNDSFVELVRKLSGYILEAIKVPHSFEELRKVAHGRSLTPLIESLTRDVHHPDVVAALLVLKGYFSSFENVDDAAINETRGFACEIVAWRFVAHLSERECIDFLLHDISKTSGEYHDEEANRVSTDYSFYRDGEEIEESATPSESYASTEDQDYLSSFENLNALEIAVVSGAKKFLSQKTVQKILNGIWNGDIVFWENMSSNSRKTARFYNRRKADPYCRLRVPKYLKTFEALFFISLLALYYAVLVERSTNHVTAAEVLLYIWIISFGYDEFGEFWDAGSTFYAADFWTLWDIAIILVGAAFFISRMIGLAHHSPKIIDTSYDILSIEALFLVPRIFSILSLNRYVGTLIPCLKEMTKDFVKFAGLVVVLYLGFLTTFTLLARDYFTPLEMSWILVNVFFGSSYLGFDVAHKISPILGPPLMIVFVVLTNILLITSLISLLSNSLTKIMDHATEEFCLTYSIFVLEASTSNRLTYFLPPLNLVPLALRPLRLCFSSQYLRSARIVLLKVTHLPHVAAIAAYEHLQHFRVKHGASENASVSSLVGPSTSFVVKPRGVVGKGALFRTSPNSVRPWPAAASASPGPTKQRPSRADSERQSPTFDTSQVPGISSASSEDVNELRATIIRLGTQVEELTAMVGHQHLQQLASAEDDNRSSI